MHINFVFTIADILEILGALFILSIFIFCKICDKQEAKRKSEQDSNDKDGAEDSSRCCYSGVKCYADDCGTCKERTNYFKEDNNGR